MLYPSIPLDIAAWSAEALLDCPDKTHVAGASAGSIIAVCHHSGLNTDVIAAACLELAEDCRKGGTRGRLGVSHLPFCDATAEKDMSWLILLLGREFCT